MSGSCVPIPKNRLTQPCPTPPGFVAALTRGCTFGSVVLRRERRYLKINSVKCVSSSNPIKLYSADRKLKTSASVLQNPKSRYEGLLGSDVRIVHRCFGSLYLQICDGNISRETRIRDFSSSGYVRRKRSARFPGASWAEINASHKRERDFPLPALPPKRQASAVVVWKSFCLGWGW